MLLSGCGCGPGLHEFEGQDAVNALEIARVIGHENDPGFAARECQQHVVAERFRKSAEVQTLASSQFGEHVPRVFPCVGRRGYETPASPIEAQDVTLEQPSVIARPGAIPEFLSHDRAQILERRKQVVEALQAGVRLRIAKSLDEEIRVQEELPLERGTHRSGASGEVSSTPRIARVPSTSSWRNTTMSSAASIVSVAVGVPRMRWAAATLLGFRRYVFGTFRSAARAVRVGKEHTSELQSRFDLVCRLLLEKKKKKTKKFDHVLKSIT